MGLIAGKIWKYGNNVNTDDIIPGSYLRSKDVQIFSAHVMEGIDPEFKKSSGLEILSLQVLISAVGLQESRLLLL